MVRRVIGALYREIRGLHEAAFVLALSAVGSQLLALVRDRLLAHTFGAGETLDVYYAAFRIPDLLFAVFASVLSVYVLLPYLADALLQSHEKARALLSAVFSWFLVLFGVTALIVGVFAHQIAAVFFEGFGSPERETLVLLMRILLLQAFLLSLSNLFGAVTQLHRKFILHAVSPLLYNLGIIIGVVGLYPFFGLAGLVLGVALGALLHLLIQVPFVAHSGLLPRFLWRLDVSFLARLIRGAFPRALTLTLQQGVLLALTAAAAYMVAGSVSIVQFAHNLQSVPLAIVGVSYSVAAFPALARLYSEGDRKAFVSHLSSALRHVLFWCVPATALLIVLRAHIVRVALGSGAFDWSDTRLVAAALALFALSLSAQAIHLLIVRAFYAAGDARTPLVVTIISSSGTIAAAFALTAAHARSEFFVSSLRGFLRVADIAGTEALVLPLAFSAVFIMHSVFLTSVFLWRYAREAFGEVGKAFVHAFAAATATAATAYLALNALAQGIRGDTLMGILLQGLVALIVGMLTAVLFFVLAQNREFAEISAAVRRRFRAC